MGAQGPGVSTSKVTRNGDACRKDRGQPLFSEGRDSQFVTPELATSLFRAGGDPLVEIVRTYRIVDDTSGEVSEALIVISRVLT
jgi:hypothetical protein